MRIVVCSRFGKDDPEQLVPGWWEHAALLGHSVTFHGKDGDGHFPPAEAFVCMSVSQQEPAWRAIKEQPGVPLYCYHWDCYSWVWSNPRPDECYDWNRWGELLGLCREVWVPSHCTAMQAYKWWGQRWGVRPHAILSGCRLWEPTDVGDDGYALCALRKIPDRWRDVFAECCAELGVPFKHTDHDLSQEDYRRAVERCRFLVSHYEEASTGGLSILEAHALGKPVLLSDSPWHGGRDYLGDRAEYFRAGDRGDFVAQLTRLYRHPPRLDRDECRAWVTQNFSYTRMMDDVLARLTACAR